VVLLHGLQDFLDRSVALSPSEIITSRRTLLSSILQVHACDAIVTLQDQRNRTRSSMRLSLPFIDYASIGRITRYSRIGAREFLFWMGTISRPQRFRPVGTHVWQDQPVANI